MNGKRKAHTCYKETWVTIPWTETLIDAAERRPWVRSFANGVFDLCPDSSVLSGSTLSIFSSHSGVGVGRLTTFVSSIERLGRAGILLFYCT